MGDVQVKGVPEDVHAELRRRAAAQGRTVRDYLLDLIIRDQRRPTRVEWLARLHQLSPADASGAELVREARLEREQQRGVGWPPPDGSRGQG
jgi:antitoxin FitA